MTDKYGKSVIPGKGIKIYAGKKRVAAALDALSDLDLFKGAKVIDLIEVAYMQGKKEGAAEVIAKIEETTRKIPHKNPGRPKARKK